ncbi:hypothetical protein INT47_003204 [Mucor saturninus]|uniref:Uncharacterized protein n=1 Tax=Mucor saturninus TaxID=64648 RepID=A0A8H7VD85_9FUNG|nr:hypothetical protein INT47_003204 [Mucor saturninus]
MVDTKPRNTTLKKLARWSPSSPNSASIPPLSSDAPFAHVHHDQLQQGSLYIIKIKQVSLAMFEGWNDDMCCFSILRSEVEPLRWSEARQLPGDFDIYDAFDECGNPPIHLWARYLKVNVPSNWFCMFEEAKRKQREWHMRQQQQFEQQQQQQQQQLQQQQNGLIRQSIIQDQNQEDYYYPPPQDGSVVLRNTDTPPVAYSNTDVSSMSLNHHNSTDESIVAPSIVASTNIIDPVMLNESSRSTTTTSLHHQPSILSTVSVNTGSMRGLNRQVLSPTPSHREVIQQQHQPERSGSIMDREKIRRHLAPGQAVITNRNSGSVVTLASTVTTLAPVNKDSPTLNHHRSKEQIHGIPENDAENDSIKNESNISAYSNEMDFPHDSDRFSIRSDISQSVVTPTPKLSVSSKSRNRPSMKKIIWG